MLLEPNKNTHPDLTVVAIAYFLLKRLKVKRVDSYCDLFQALKKHNEKATSLLDLSLEFLFILGLIEYHDKNDLIEYVGK
ncbi:ABC-three component system middle component 8 [Vibrio chaetopteri]|uniref:ABC-three component system middle component 8 n=1 Tax=Vibrio chaetopteri TaxID=3016528 RepID=UPI003AB5F379